MSVFFIVVCFLKLLLYLNCTLQFFAIFLIWDLRWLFKLRWLIFLKFYYEFLYLSSDNVDRECQPHWFVIFTLVIGCNKHFRLRLKIDALSSHVCIWNSFAIRWSSIMTHLVVLVVRLVFWRFLFFHLFHVCWCCT